MYLSQRARVSVAFFVVLAIALGAFLHPGYGFACLFIAFLRALMG